MNRCGTSFFGLLAARGTTSFCGPGRRTAFSQSLQHNGWNPPASSSSPSSHTSSPAFFFARHSNIFSTHSSASSRSALAAPPHILPPRLSFLREFFKRSYSTGRPIVKRSGGFGFGFFKRSRDRVSGEECRFYAFDHRGVGRMYATEPPPTSVPKYPSQSQSQPQYTPRTPSSTSAQSSQLPPPSRSDGASTTLSPPPSSGYHPASYGAAALGSVTQSWRVARAELLDNVGGFWPRLRLRIRLFLMGSQRPWRADDVFALFSWIFMGHTLFLLVGTTTFLSLLLGVANSLQFQAYLGKAISDYVTEETGMKVTFESAIVPRWKEGVIRLENVSIICNDQTWTELKNAERRHKGMLPYGPGELDVNWTYWDLTFRHIDVTLSLWRWLDGKGLIKECSLKGVRGEIDRRHVEWPEDWTPIRREPQAGDFEMSRFVVEDLLVTIRNPKFRPYSVSIFTAEMPQLRKQWLLYDLMRADIMNGMFDNCLFSVHKPQRPELVLSDDGDAQPKWGKMSHLKLNGLPIDHLNAGVQGPLGWITRGYLDIDLQLLFPQTENDDFLSIIRDELDGLTDVALDKIEEVISRHPETANRLESPIIRHYRSKHDDNAVETSSMPSNTVTANKEAPAMVMVWNVRLNDIKASVPLVSPHISYINSALIRPIVGYLNAVKTSISISFRAKMDVSNFDGAWTIYQASLTEVLAEEVGRAITQLVAQQRAQHLRRVATWSLQSVTRNLAALVEYARGVRGWREWNEGRLGPMGSGMWTGI